jgi:hypothetical protein
VFKDPINVITNSIPVYRILPEYFLEMKLLLKLLQSNAAAMSWWPCYNSRQADLKFSRLACLVYRKRQFPFVNNFFQLGSVVVKALCYKPEGRGLIPYEVDFLNSEILKAYHLADQFGHI